MKLLIEVKSCLRLVSYAPGRIELEPTENAPRDLINRLKRMLQEATGVHGSCRSAPAARPRSRRPRTSRKPALTAEVEKHPLMQAIRDAFPEARIEQIRTRADLTRAAAGRSPAGDAGRGRHARGLGPVRGLMPPVRQNAADPGLFACDARPRGVSGVKPPRRG
jgi:hypothetical protein